MWCKARSATENANQNGAKINQRNARKPEERGKNKRTQQKERGWVGEEPGTIVKGEPKVQTNEW